MEFNKPTEFVTYSNDVFILKFTSRNKVLWTMAELQALENGGGCKCAHLEFFPRDKIQENNYRANFLAFSKQNKFRSIDNKLVI